MAATDPLETGAARGVSQGDADGDGMPDHWNARMPALSFLMAMLTLAPTLFAIRASVEVIRGEAAARFSAFAWNIGTLAIATLAIIFAAYGARAATKGLASAGRWIAILQAILALILIIVLFFKK